MAMILLSSGGHLPPTNPNVIEMFWKLFKAQVLNNRNYEIFDQSSWSAGCYFPMHINIVRGSVRYGSRISRLFVINENLAICICNA